MSHWSIRHFILQLYWLVSRRRFLEEVFFVLLVFFYILDATNLENLENPCTDNVLPQKHSVSTLVLIKAWHTEKVVSSFVCNMHGTINNGLWAGYGLGVLSWYRCCYFAKWCTHDFHLLDHTTVEKNPIDTLKEGPECHWLGFNPNGFESSFSVVSSVL